MVPLLRKAFWLFGIAFLMLVIFLPGYTKLQVLKDKNADLEGKIKNLSIENALLEQQLVRITNDPVYQEKVMREKMGVVRKGEVPIKVVPEKKK